MERQGRVRFEVISNDLDLGFCIYDNLTDEWDDEEYIDEDQAKSECERRNLQWRHNADS